MNRPNDFYYLYWSNCVFKIVLKISVIITTVPVYPYSK